MKKSSILAHRGIWSQRSASNSKESLKYALESGFGLETDIRDLNGSLVISHDPPIQNSQAIALSWLLEIFAKSNCKSRIALNIKADGLRNMLIEVIENTLFPAEQCFVFDMSVPDFIMYMDCAIPVYARISEHEDHIPFYNKVKGVWIDSFDGEFAQVQRAMELLDLGLRTTIVSSELHGRDPMPLWDEILNSQIYCNPLFELCTDHPFEALAVFAD